MHIEVAHDTRGTWHTIPSSKKESANTTANLMSPGVTLFQVILSKSDHGLREYRILAVFTSDKLRKTFQNVSKVLKFRRLVTFYKSLGLVSRHCLAHNF